MRHKSAEILPLFLPLFRLILPFSPTAILLRFSHVSTTLLPFCRCSANVRPSSSEILPASSVLHIATSRIHPILPLFTLFFPSVAFFRSRKKKKKEEKMADGPFAKVRAYGRCAATRLATCKGHKGRVGEGCCTAGTEKEAGSLSGFKCTQYSWRPLAMCKEKRGNGRERQEKGREKA